MNQSSTVFVGMDVHKDSIEIALADAGEVRRYGQIEGDASAVDRAVRKLRSTQSQPGVRLRGGSLRLLLYRLLAAQRLLTALSHINVMSSGGRLLRVRSN